MTKDIVLIDWIDATYDIDGWQQKDESAEYNLDPIHIQSVGFLVGQTAEYITLLQTLAEDEGFMNRFTIPQGCIKKITTLKKGTGKLNYEEPTKKASSNNLKIKK
jgi:hypothetical protein